MRLVTFQTFGCIWDIQDFCFLSDLSLNILLKYFYFGKSRSSHPEVFCKKGAFKKFTKFTGKHLFLSLFFNNVAGLRRRPQIRDSCTGVFQ